MELASAEMMMALKLMAGRDKDIEDLYALMRKTNTYSSRQLVQNLHRFTGNRFLEHVRSGQSFFHLDETLKRIERDAPNDIQQAARLAELSWREKAKAEKRAQRERAKARKRAAKDRRRCPVMRKTMINGTTVYRSRCIRMAGHKWPHVFRRVD